MQRNDSSDQALTYHPSWLSVFLHRLASACRRVVPGRYYPFLYDTAFRFYKGLVRLLYYRYVLYRAIRGDGEQLQKVRTIHRVMPHSLVGASGLAATYDAVIDIGQRGVDGDIVECGVARGGCAGLMGLAARKDRKARKLWLFDSFAGLSEPTSDDYVGESTGKHVRPLSRGSCLGTLEDVEEFLFSDLRLERGNVSLVKGWFQDTLPISRHQVGPIALLRIDGDWYESTKCCLENLYDNVSPGGWVIVDDYGTCFGCKRAVDEFLAGRNLKVSLRGDGRGGCIFAKPG